MEAVLAYLEGCVTERRTARLQANRGEAGIESGSVTDGYLWFFEKCLGVSVPGAGEIVEHTAKRIVMRWWNPCPTLEACKQLGLDMREICKKAYHKPVQAFLEQIHPGLRFGRKYGRLRPYATCCEETIELVE